MAHRYPNPLSDIPKQNGCRVHLPNQCERNEDLTFLLAQPVKGPGKADKRLSWIAKAINLVVLVLLASIIAMMVRQVCAIAVSESRKVERVDDETLRQMHERHKQEAVGVHP